MTETVPLTDRRTTAEMVFERLHGEIMTLALLPGAKLSETDVAKRFGVSRQPVRDAFNRLAALDLLLIRPQRATVVRGFSMEAVAHARFLRLAVELEVTRRACAVWNAESVALLDRNLARQRKAIDADRTVEFHAADREFHELICVRGGLPLAVETIRAFKQKVDRLCTLSLRQNRESEILFEDHRLMADALARRSCDEAVAFMRRHLARLDDAIAEVRRTHPDYFEPSG